jgi:tellurite resistance protein
MFRRIFSSNAGTKNDPASQQAAEQTEAAFSAASAAKSTAGDTATVRRIVARLEEMPPDKARLIASAAYTIARAAYADLDISDEETALIEQELQSTKGLDEPTAVLVTEMAKLQARTVGGTEDYVVTREFTKLASEQQRINVLRACFMVSAASGSISAEESAEVNQIANELGLDPSVVAGIRADFHDRLSAVQAVRRAAGQA